MKNKKYFDELLIIANQKAKERDYWLTKMAGNPVKTFFPYDYHPIGKEPVLSIMKFNLPSPLVSRLLTVSQYSPQTLHVIFLTALTVLLRQYTGSQDIITATPIYKQEIETEYINTVLVLRIRLNDWSTFKELLLQMKQTMVEAVENQNYPMEILPEQLKLEKFENDFPLTDVAILLKNIHDKKYIQHIHPNIIFSFQQENGAIESELEYNRRLYSQATIDRMITHFISLLEQGLFNTDTVISAIDILSVEERKQLLLEFNDTAREYPKEKTIPELFAQQVQKKPDYPAVVVENQETNDILSLTYGGLNRKSNQLACILKEKGVKPGDLVGLMIDRSLDMVIGILGILKAGGAYVPIDTQAPPARILSILEDCNTSLLLTGSRIIKKHSFHDLQGISKHLTGQEVYQTGVQPIITNLDQLPMPNRALVNYEKYHAYIGQSLIKHTISMLGTRGCPFRCAYCHNIWPKKQITRSAENIFQEVRLYYHMGVRRFVFLDDVFNLNVKNTTRFFELIIENGLNLQLSLCLRGDILTKDYIDLMVKAGTLRMALALETASPRVQKLMGKKLNLEKFRENIEYICKTYPQVILELNTMLGFPSETREEARMTLDFIKSLRWIHFPYVNILKIYQNTEMEKLALANGISREAIRASANLAYHELPETLPFDKSFTLEYQAEFLNEYFLLKERLLHVLPYQARVLTEDELVQKYNSYLTVDIRCLNDLLEFTGISQQELEERGVTGFLEEEQVAVPRFNEKLNNHFNPQPVAENTFRVLLLDLSQLFNAGVEGEAILYDVVEPPLGLIYIMTYLQQQFGDRISGKVAKSRIDFENYHELKELLETFQPHVIGIRTLTYYRDFFHRTTAMIRNWGLEIPIVTGGPYATSDYQTLLSDPNINLAVLGEGEVTFSQLIGAMLNNKGKLPGIEVLKGIKGLAFHVRTAHPSAGRGCSRQILMMDVLSEAFTRESDIDPHHVNQSTELAYTIFTSGSTGQPKGVMLEHRNVINLVSGLYERIYQDYTGPRKVALVSPYIFDASIKQIFAALLLGHSLYIVPENTRIDGNALIRFYRRNEIDISDGTPAHLFLMWESMKYTHGRAEMNSNPGVKHFIIGGEALSRKLVNDFFRVCQPHAPIITNVYGPTECCVDATSYHVVRENPEGKGDIEIPIGKPMPNHQIFIKDNLHRLLPFGIAGELYIAGAGVARGYLNNPELTSKRFINYNVQNYTTNGILEFMQSCNHASMQYHSLSYQYPITPLPHSPIYRTGDLARWLADGNIEFLGRIDYQVQIRGYRIELEEIRSQLLRHEEVKDVVVTTKGLAAANGSAGGKNNQDEYICAYIVSDREVYISQLKEYLSGKLPGYMIPAYFKQVEKIPLTPNGKTDYKALPAPQPGAEKANYIAPANQIEKKLLGIWHEVLGVPLSSIGMRDNFFDLGGHSLKAIILVNRIHREFLVEFPLSEVFGSTTIQLSARYIAAARKKRYEKIQPVEKREYYRCSSVQTRLYILHQMEKNFTAYNIPAVLILEGKLHRQRLDQTFRKLIKQHESFKTSFVLLAGEPVQRIHDRVEFEIEYYEAGKRQEVRGNKEKLMPESLIRDFIRPFDLSQAPLLRVELIHTRAWGHSSQEGNTGGRYILMMDMHHIISDGTSTRILIEDFMGLYAVKELSPLRIRYRDYSDWQNRQFESKKMQQQEAFWLQELKEDLPVLNLPTDDKRKPVQDFEGDMVTIEIPQKETAMLKALAAAEEATLYMVLLSVCYLVLANVSRQEDIIVGSVVEGRNHDDLRQVIGMFVNTLPLRNYPHPEKTYRRFLQEVRECTINTFENQDYPFKELVEKVSTHRDGSQNPLFDVAFVFQNQETPELKIPGLKLTHYEYDNKTSKFDLTLVAVERGEDLLMGIEYRTALFKETTIKRFCEFLKKIIVSVIAHPGRKIGEIEIISDAEKKQVLYDFNDTETEYPKDKTIHQLFEEQVERTPDNTALVGGNSKSQIPNPKRGAAFGQITTCGSMQLSYRQLHEKSDHLAHFLNKKGVQADTIVGIMVERSIELIIGILGILKSGSAYLPIDAEYPEERIQYMLKDSNAQVLVLDDTSCVSWLSFAPKAILNLSEGYHLNFPASQIPSFSASLPTSLAYIIYTSGTTGKPKAVMIQHRNVVRLMVNERSSSYFDFTENDVWTMFHSYCFDFSVWEMYGALLYGGKLVIIPKMTARDPEGFLKELKEKNVTILNQTPTAFYNLSTEELKHHTRDLNLRWVIFGGEALKPRKLFQWRKKYPGIKLINMFGITETTVHVTYKEISGKEIELNISNIGRPIPTLSTYIMDKNLKLLPSGIPGELCVGGEGVARGYLNRVELTATKFLANPYKPKEIIYRSSDQAKFLDNGEMEYLGRIDHQVQVKGYRIEPGEIENQLLKYRKIKEVVVLTGEEEGGNYLCAYIVSDNEFTLSELRTYLSGKLPAYMIPSYFVRLERIPLTPNGKVDRKALPGVRENLELLEEYTSPTTETEEILVEIWESVLEIKVGINRNFFHSGGDSIKAVRLINLINTKLSANLKIPDIYLNGTIKKLGDKIDREKGLYEYTRDELSEALKEIEELRNRLMSGVKLPEEIEDIYLMSDIQKGMVFHSLKDTESAVYHDQMVYQAEINGFDTDIFKKAVVSLVEKHSILRTVFNLEIYDQPVQMVYRSVPCDMEHYDISNMEKAEQEEYLFEYLAEDRQKTFKFGVPPLWRMRTFYFGNDIICLLLVVHHAILDGWSVASLVTELINTYWKLKANPEFIPGKLKNSYKALIVEQLLQKKRDDALDFWKNELDGYKRLELSYSLKNDERENVVNSYKYPLKKELLSKLKHISKSCQTTIRSLCFGAYVYMLNMLSYENEIVVGMVTNNRPICEDGEKILGCFLNTIPVRMEIPARISWLDYINMVEKKLLELKKYERMPLLEIVRIIGENSQGKNPIFDTIFNFVDFHVFDRIEQEYGKDYIFNHSLEGRVVTNTLSDFTVSTTFGDFNLFISYSNWLFNEKTVNNLCCYFEGVLNKFITEPGSIANKFELILVEEKQKLLHEFNNTNALYPKEITVHELFEEQVERTPDKIAVVGSSLSLKEKHLKSFENVDVSPLFIQLSYKDLKEKANRLAYELQTKGVEPDSIIGVMVERSVEMMVGILGVLKAGSGYLPIDPGYPPERINYILKDSQAKMLLTQKAVKKEINAASIQEVIDLNNSALYSRDKRNLSKIIEPGYLAYIIYTSGSTGKPKGIMVEHSSLVNLLAALFKQYPFSPQDTYLLKTPYVFDVSITELFGWFFGGGRLAVLERGEEKDPGKILDTIEHCSITHINFVPSMFNVFVNTLDQGNISKLSSLKYIFLAGESLLPEPVKKLKALNSGIMLENLYGPTEAAVYSSRYSLSNWDSRGNIPIGKPLPNVELYVLDRYGHLQPIGVAGELYISGCGVARGYLNTPELTFERFINYKLQITNKKKTTLPYSPHLPHSPYSPIYKTGDLARWLPDGNIEFQGRIDHQVKLRGFRVELGEIENCLLSCDRVKEAAVVVKETQTGDKHLCAYLVPDNLEKEDLGAGENELSAVLKEYLLSRLPGYMIPQYFVPLEMLPLTVNGKLDSESLPEPGISAAEDYIAPRDESEEKLADIWAGLLGVNKDFISIDANFFDLGGHSLNAIKLVGRIKKEFGATIPLDELFRTPTLRGISSLLEVTRWVKEQGIGTNLQQQGKEILL